MNLWPGGDAYFGALLNSWIHVMMYSYYTLSLLKIRCPWKKYLTQAQLIQFLTVLAYTAVSYSMLPDDSNWRHVGAHAIQTAEMVSLFVLFLHFYQRAYSKKKRDSQKQLEREESDAASDSAAEQASLSSASTEDGDDQCQTQPSATS
jgi:elongation of very long chain fatty acids protein 4